MATAATAAAAATPLDLSTYFERLLARCVSRRCRRTAAVARATDAHVRAAMCSTRGLLAIVLSDRDGVTVATGTRPCDAAAVRCAHTGDGANAGDAAGTAPAGFLVPAHLATLAAASEHAAKLGMGRSRAIVADFAQHRVVHFHLGPFIVSLVATADANTGVLLSLGADLRAAVDPVVVALRAQFPELQS